MYTSFCYNIYVIAAVEEDYYIELFVYVLVDIILKLKHRLAYCGLV